MQNSSVDENGRGGRIEIDKDETRYYSIHGTVPGSAVAAQSHLCEDLLQQMIEKSQNLRGEIEIPAAFYDF